MSSDRPATSKPRGVCRYYDTPRGCFAGSQCKFLHGEDAKQTPFDMNKICKFYTAGYCRKGSKCWFLHTATDAYGRPVVPATPVESETEDMDNLCSICYEKPTTFGLLAGCSHIFCVQCIREWRDPSGKSEDVVSSGVTKTCPLCRASSRFVTPSSQFYPDGHPGKVSIIEGYKTSMAKVPCRHFQKSTPGDRFCPFGKDCFYQHANDDGTPYLFEHGVDYYMKIYKRRLQRERYNNYSQRSFPWLDLLYHSVDDFGFVEDLPDNYIVQAGMQNVHGDHPVESELDRPTVQRVQELVELLGSLSINDENAEDDAPYQFETVNPWTSEGNPENSSAVHSEIAPHVSWTLPSHSHFGDFSSPSTDSPSPGCTHPELFATTPHSPVSSSTSQTPSTSTSTGPSAINPRFSTVVRDRPRFIADLSSGNIDDTQISSPGSDTRQFIWSANDLATQATAPVSSVEDVHSPERAATHVGEDHTQHTEVLDCSGGATSMQCEIRREEAASAPPVLETLHNADPPFLTDGRGRVVWSSATAVATRQREGRRARPRAISSSAQHKSRRETTDGDAAAACAAGETAQGATCAA